LEQDDSEDKEKNKEKVKDHLEKAVNFNCSHAKYELLSMQKNAISTDAGKRLQWFRELRECATTHNQEAVFDFVRCLLSNHSCKNEMMNTKELARDLFGGCQCSKIDKLEQYQPKINSLMRCILVDWLAEVAYMKDMSHQVLHAAVAYVDRYLMSRVVERTKLQLLGIACLLLAAKYVSNDLFQ